MCPAPNEGLTASINDSGQRFMQVAVKKVLKYWVITVSCGRDHAQGWVRFHRDPQTFQWTSQCCEALNEPTVRSVHITLWITNKGSQTAGGIINTC